VEEGSPCDVGDGRPDLLPGVDDVDPEGIDSVTPNVISVHPTYQHLTLVVVHKQTTNHDEPV
jgi:hypothetical protein